MSEGSRVSASETKGAGKKRYAMVVDTRRCIGCMACQVACKAEYDTPLGVNRTWVPYKVVGKYPNVKKQFLPRLCNHCEDPPCVRNCPVEATFKVEDGGFVLQRYERCIGCRSCMAACPYNARFMLPSHRTYTPITNVVDKCTFCFHRVTQNLVPACVQTCIGRSRVFGDINDPNSEVSYLVAKNADPGAAPGRRYQAARLLYRCRPQHDRVRPRRLQADRRDGAGTLRFQAPLQAFKGNNHG